LVSDVSEGTFDVEETYSEALQTILKTKLEQFHPGLFDNLLVEELKTFYVIFTGALIETKI